MKPLLIVTVALYTITHLASCDDIGSTNAKSELKTEYDLTQTRVNDNLFSLDSITGAMENTDSFSMERYGAAVDVKDSLYKLLDSLMKRQQVLDSLLQQN